MKRLFKIVIVDDEKILRQGLVLSGNWHENGFIFVYEASNGKEAIDVIENEARYCDYRYYYACYGRYRTYKELKKNNPILRLLY